MAGTDASVNAREPDDPSTFLIPQRIRLYDFARVDDATLLAAKRTAEVIFHGAGLRVEWVDCIAHWRGGMERFTCARAFRPGDFVVRIVAPASGPRAPLKPHTLGFAALDREGDRGYLATVFWPLVKRTAELSGVAPGTALGCVIAHELGHLLLRTTGHAVSGIMSREWDEDDLRRLLREGMQFSSQQAERMRAEVIDRHAAREEQSPFDLAQRKEARRALAPKTPFIHAVGGSDSP